MNTLAPAPQSTFVTVLAWLVIVLNGFGILISAMQNVMINFLMPAMIAGSPNPASQAFPLLLARVGVFAFLCVAVFMTFVGYALLKRRNWARYTLIVVCALGVAWTLACIVMFAFGFGAGHFPAPPPGTPPGFNSGFKVMFAMMSIVSLATCAVLAWIIKRMCAPAIKAEFEHPTLVG